MKNIHYLPGILTALLFLGYVLLWRIKKYELRKSSGEDSDVYLKATRPIQKYFGYLERIMTVLVVVLIIVHMFFLNSFIALQPITSLNPMQSSLLGFFVGIIGLTFCRIAQVTMGKSWRVGIDEKAKAGLVTNGIYRYIRNPTYTGLYILCAGVITINPTILFSYWIISFFIMMEFQVRCEEEYLENLYGAEYKEYVSKTKRYIPFIY